MSLRGKHLHVDCASGAAGDMMLGALIDLGVPVDVVGDALDAIGAGRERLRIRKVAKRGIAATDLTVDTAGSLAGAAAHQHAVDADPSGPGLPTGRHHEHLPEDEHDDRDVLGQGRRAPRDTMMTPFGEAMRSDGRHHRDTALTPVVEAAAAAPASPMPLARSATDGARDGHAHSHGSHSHSHARSHDAHAHYHYTEIRARIAGASLTPETKRRALDIFDRIARAEATIHATTVEAVAFHEVGAIDSVVDVVGTAAALAWLEPSGVTCTGVAMGHGTITCAHGVLPVPAPAALEVMRAAKGVMTDGGIARELCTPTGAAILAASVTSWTPAPAGTPLAIGWGAGDAELADRANVLRAVVIEPAGGTTQTVWQVDANIDDMSPELCGPAAEAVFAAGALDVWWTPITMKKGRPALTLSALAETAVREAVVAAILRETTTIGVRYSPRERTVLGRRSVEVPTRYGGIPIKLAMQGESVVNAAPEYEACAAAAKVYGVPLKLVFAAALAAYDAQR